MDTIWAYDFDKTIYKGDSSIDFFFFCLKKQKSLIKHLPKIGILTFLYIIKKRTTKEYKEQFFAFLKGIENIDSLVLEFWQKQKDNVYEFFLNDEKVLQRPTIYIISASPEFLLKGFTKNFTNIVLIGTKMDKKTGKITGENCKGKEKVNRLNKNVKIQKFYSDSYSDTPLANLANKAYIVKKGRLIKWDKNVN